MILLIRHRYRQILFLFVFTSFQIQNLFFIIYHLHNLLLFGLSLLLALRLTQLSYLSHRQHLQYLEDLYLFTFLPFHIIFSKFLNVSRSLYIIHFLFYFIFFFASLFAVFLFLYAEFLKLFQKEVFVFFLLPVGHILSFQVLLIYPRLKAYPSLLTYHQLLYSRVVCLSLQYLCKQQQYQD